jgi:hypothetical protein
MVTAMTLNFLTASSACTATFAFVISDSRLDTLFFALLQPCLDFSLHSLRGLAG